MFYDFLNKKEFRYCRYKLQFKLAISMYAPMCLVLEVMFSQVYLICN